MRWLRSTTRRPGASGEVSIPREPRCGLDDPQVRQSNRPDESEAQVTHQEAGDLGLGDILSRHVEAECLGGQPAAVRELDPRIEVRAVGGGLTGRGHGFS